MNYEEFKFEVVEKIKEFLPKKYADADVSIKTVVKNNDQKLDGLMVKLQDSNIAPNIYLNQFYEQHEDGRPMYDILASIADIRVQHETSHDFDVSRLTDFDSVKNRITCHLVNAEQNAEYLEDKPYTMVDDLAVTYHIAIGKQEIGTMSAPITNKLMKGYGVDVEQLHKIAIENMDTLTPATFKSMTDTLIDLMMPEMMESGMSEEEAKKMISSMYYFRPEAMPYVLSNEDKLFGASVILNNKVMDTIKQKIGRDFYILPSSVHETLIVPKTEQTNLKELECIVMQVNITDAAPEEKLSDHVYVYNAKEHEILRADKAKAVKKARPSVKDKLAQKKDIAAKSSDNKESHSIKNKDEQALA